MGGSTSLGAPKAPNSPYMVEPNATGGKGGSSAPATQPQYQPTIVQPTIQPTAQPQTTVQQSNWQPQYQQPTYSVDAWGRSVPMQQGFAPASFNSGPGTPIIYGNNTMPINNEALNSGLGPIGSTGGGYTGNNGGYTGYTNNDFNRFPGFDAFPTFGSSGTAGTGSVSNSGSTHNSGDPNNPNPFAVNDPASYDRKFDPFGWAAPDSPERAAERAYNQANPGQDDGWANYIFGTGKYETKHPLDVTHNQTIGNNRQGYGDFNTNGLGRDTNYDRFGNIRTTIPNDFASGNYYWNSSTGAWTDKTTGIPKGGSINDPKSTPDVVKKKAIADTLAEQARQKKAGEDAAAALLARQNANKNDKKSAAHRQAEADVRSQLNTQAKKDNVTPEGRIRNQFEANRP